MTTSINSSLELPCGATIKNRLAKAAMSENMATKDHRPNKKFGQLYRQWAEGGCGLVITGNVMVDHRQLGEPRNVVLSEEYGTPENFKSWVENGTKNGCQLWMQINHPGKQSPKFLNKNPVAPSSIPLSGPLGKMFETPSALEPSEIENIIQEFGITAKKAKEFGFTGVQIHGAHGYLVSQFLSPRHNQRDDQWGGSVENRLRFALEILKEIRAQVGDSFPIGIKINSADFMKGGQSEEESIEIASKLSEAGMDLIEISGGSYEAPIMMEGQRKKESTEKREAYFLDFCQKLRNKISTPLMLTGGFRSLEGMQEALNENACHVIGLARSLAIRPEWPNELLAGTAQKSLVKPLTTGFRKVDRLVPLEITWYTQQLHKMGMGRAPDPKASPWLSIFKSIYGYGLESISRVRS